MQFSSFLSLQIDHLYSHEHKHYQNLHNDEAHRYDQQWLNLNAKYNSK